MRHECFFTDRGRGFNNSGSGRITDEYRDALAVHGLETFMGECAVVQPGKLSDCMLHETAAAWLRLQLARSLPRKPWEGSTSQYYARLKRITRSANAACDVDGLYNAFPARVEALRAREGGKLGR